MFACCPPPSLLARLQDVGELSKGPGKVCEDIVGVKWKEETPHVPFDVLLVPGCNFGFCVVKCGRQRQKRSIVSEALRFSHRSMDARGPRCELWNWTGRGGNAK